MEQPKSQTEFDPNRTVFTAPAARFSYMDHPIAGKLMINNDTKVITQIAGQLYPGMPLKLPKALMDVGQPAVRTCGKPTDDNLGCLAAVNGGCPILVQYGRIGPVNIIIEKNGNVNSAPCHHVYCGITQMGRPTSQAHLLLDGWQILTDRTTIPENVRDGKGMREYVRQTEVPDLAPFYEQGRVGRYAEAPKKRGRPKKVVAVAD